MPACRVIYHLRSHRRLRASGNGRVQRSRGVLPRDRSAAARAQSPARSTSHRTATVAHAGRGPAGVLLAGCTGCRLLAPCSPLPLLDSFVVRQVRSSVSSGRERCRTHVLLEFLKSHPFQLPFPFLRLTWDGGRSLDGDRQDDLFPVCDVSGVTTGTPCRGAEAPRHIGLAASTMARC